MMNLLFLLKEKLYSVALYVMHWLSFTAVLSAGGKGVAASMPTV